MQMRIRSRWTPSTKPTRRSRRCATCSSACARSTRPKTLIFISEGFRVERSVDDVDRARHSGGGGAHQPVRAAARQAAVRRRGRANGAEPVRRSPGGDRGARDAGRRGARHAVHGHRLRRGAVLAHRVGALRLLPARRRVGSARSRRQAAPDSRRRAAARRDVRSRRQILNAPSDEAAARAARSPRRAMAAALGSPLLSSALPLRVASFSLQGPERDKVQLLIHADIGTDYPRRRSSRSAT